MKKKDRGLPEVMFVGPPKHREAYKLVVMKVEEKDEYGIPRKLTILFDNESIKIDGGEEFITGYIMEVMTKPESER